MSDLNDLLYEIFHYQHRGCVERVAEVAGLARRTVDEYATDNRKTVPVNVIKASWLVTEDPRLKRLLEPEGWTLVPKDEALAPTSDWEKEIGDVYMAVTGILDEVRKAIEDGKIDRNEEVGIRARINAAKLQLAELESMLEPSVARLRLVKAAQGAKARG